MGDCGNVSICTRNIFMLHEKNDNNSLQMSSASLLLCGVNNLYAVVTLSKV